MQQRCRIHISWKGGRCCGSTTPIGVLLLLVWFHTIRQTLHLKFSAAVTNFRRTVYFQRPLTRSTESKRCRKEPRPPGMNQADERVSGRLWIQIPGSRLFMWARRRRSSNGINDRLHQEQHTVAYEGYVLQLGDENRWIVGNLYHRTICSLAGR